MNNTLSIGQRIAQGSLPTLRKAKERREVYVAGEMAKYGRGVSGDYKAEGQLAKSILDSVQLDSTDEVEKIVARETRKICGKVKKWSTVAKMAHGSLPIIAAGVGGSVGVALATIGFESLFRNDGIPADQRDRAFAGVSFIQAIRDHSEDPAQRAMAKATVNSVFSMSDLDSQAYLIRDFLRDQPRI